MPLQSSPLSPLRPPDYTNGRSARTEGKLLVVMSCNVATDSSSVKVVLANTLDAGNFPVKYKEEGVLAADKCPKGNQARKFFEDAWAEACQ
ncbi:hypothetical protein WJX74_009467 [Apatococcus lobatus]|uniref:Uncharacterized protein n=1 Tax=Apatococcus lobatus TaxID=904363 RepID=A0AAW1QUR2_9CHLO